MLGKVSLRLLGHITSLHRDLVDEFAYKDSGLSIIHAEALELLFTAKILPQAEEFARLKGSESFYSLEYQQLQGIFQRMVDYRENALRDKE